jgi:hypothetical protein
VLFAGSTVAQPPLQVGALASMAGSTALPVVVTSLHTESGLREAGNMVAGHPCQKGRPVAELARDFPAFDFSSLLIVRTPKHHALIKRAILYPSLLRTIFPTKPLITCGSFRLVSLRPQTCGHGTSPRRGGIVTSATLTSASTISESGSRHKPYGTRAYSLLGTLDFTTSLDWEQCKIARLLKPFYSSARYGQRL